MQIIQSLPTIICKMRSARLDMLVSNSEKPRRPLVLILPAQGGLGALGLFELVFQPGCKGVLFRVNGGSDISPEPPGLIRQLLLWRRCDFGRGEERRDVDEQLFILRIRRQVKIYPFMP